MIEEILIKMIKNIPFFEHIDDSLALELSKEFKLNYIPNWTAIIIEWKPIDKIFILKTWKLEVRKAEWLWSKILWYINPWEIFWEMSFYYKRLPIASVISIQDSEVWEITHHAFEKFLDKYPDVKKRIEDIINERELQNKKDKNDIIDEILTINL